MSYLEVVLSKAIKLRESGKLLEARSFLEEHIGIFSDRADFLSLLGQISEQMGDNAHAIKYLEATLNIDKSKLDAVFTLGVAYQMAGRNLEAIELLDKIIAAAPHIPHSYRHKGMAMESLGNDAEAKQLYEEALEINPDYPEALGSIGNLLMKHYHFNAAEFYMKKGLQQNHKMNDVLNNLARLYQLSGYSDKATEIFRDVFANEPSNFMALSNILYSLSYLDSIKPEDIKLQSIELCSAFFAKNIEKKPLVNQRKNRKVNVGYISNDFCLHSVSFFIEPVLIHHDRNKFQIFCYSNCQRADSTTDRIRLLDIQWRDIASLSAEEATEVIIDDKIDIIIDLSGHTARNRLDICALKPAPVMAEWIGYPATTGMKQFDYYISDHICDPEGVTDYQYSEKVFRLPQVFSCYLPPLDFPAVAETPYKLNGYITFGSFNNLAKVTEKTIRLWSAVLSKVPNSKIFLKSASLGGDLAKERILNLFSKYQISEDRLILKVHAPTPFEHLKLYSEIDIALDTFPYNGTTTTCEALWMGVPVVSYLGESHHSRVSASFLINVGLPELVADSEESFVEIAANLAADVTQLKNYRNRLRMMMANSPLMDYKGVTAELEMSYLKMAGIHE